MSTHQEDELIHLLAPWDAYIKDGVPLQGTRPQIAVDLEDCLERVFRQGIRDAVAFEWVLYAILQLNNILMENDIVNGQVVSQRSKTLWSNNPTSVKKGTKKPPARKPLRRLRRTRDILLEGVPSETVPVEEVPSAALPRRPRRRNRTQLENLAGEFVYQRPQPQPQSPETEEESEVLVPLRAPEEEEEEEEEEKPVTKKRNNPIDTSESTNRDRRRRRERQVNPPSVIREYILIDDDDDDDRDADEKGERKGAPKRQRVQVTQTLTRKALFYLFDTAQNVHTQTLLPYFSPREWHHMLPLCKEFLGLAVGQGGINMVVPAVRQRLSLSWTNLWVPNEMFSGTKGDFIQVLSFPFDRTARRVMMTNCGITYQRLFRVGAPTTNPNRSIQLTDIMIAPSPKDVRAVYVGFVCEAKLDVRSAFRALTDLLTGRFVYRYDLVAKAFRPRVLTELEKEVVTLRVIVLFFMDFVDIRNWIGEGTFPMEIPEVFADSATESFIERLAKQGELMCKTRLQTFREQHSRAVSPDKREFSPVAIDRIRAKVRLYIDQSERVDPIDEANVTRVVQFLTDPTQPEFMPFVSALPAGSDLSSVIKQRVVDRRVFYAAYASGLVLGDEKEDPLAIVEMIFNGLVRSNLADTTEELVSLMHHMRKGVTKYFYRGWGRWSGVYVWRVLSDDGLLQENGLEHLSEQRFSEELCNPWVVQHLPTRMECVHFHLGKYNGFLATLQKYHNKNIQDESLDDLWWDNLCERYKDLMLVEDDNVYAKAELDQPKPQSPFNIDAFDAIVAHGGSMLKDMSATKLAFLLRDVEEAFFDNVPRQTRYQSLFSNPEYIQRLARIGSRNPFWQHWFQRSWAWKNHDGSYAIPPLNDEWLFRLVDAVAPFENTEIPYKYIYTTAVRNATFTAMDDQKNVARIRLLAEHEVVSAISAFNKWRVGVSALKTRYAFLFLCRQQLPGMLWLFPLWLVANHNDEGKYGIDKQSLSVYMQTVLVNTNVDKFMRQDVNDENTTLHRFEFTDYHIALARACILLMYQYQAVMELQHHQPLGRMLDLLANALNIPMRLRQPGGLPMRLLPHKQHWAKVPLLWASILYQRPFHHYDYTLFQLVHKYFLGDDDDLWNRALTDCLKENDVQKDINMEYENEWELVSHNMTLIHDYAVQRETRFEPHRYYPANKVETKEEKDEKESISYPERIRRWDHIVHNDKGEFGQLPDKWPSDAYLKQFKRLESRRKERQRGRRPSASIRPTLEWVLPLREHDLIDFGWIASPDESLILKIEYDKNTIQIPRSSRAGILDPFTYE